MSSSDLSDSGEESEQEVKKSRKETSNKASKRKFESEEDDEVDSEEEEDTNPNYKKSKKKRGVEDFFLEEADVDDDEDESEDEDGEAIGDLLPPEDAEAEEYGHHTALDLDSKRRMAEILNQDENEIEEYYRRRYQEADIGDRFGGGEAMTDEISQQGLLPGVKDPNLWIVKCRHGEEKATVLSLMRKMIAYQASDEPLQIKSALAKEGLSGYIYIEAYKQTHVKQAIEGINALVRGKWSQKMVAINEMTDVLRVVKETASLKEDQWVRCKRGPYKDDLAQVQYVEDAQNQVMLKLVPRINYNKKRGYLKQTAKDDDDDLDKSKVNKRPPQSLFNVERIREIGGEVTPDGGMYIFEGNRYDPDGFLHKMFRINAIISDGVKPTLSELEKFNETPDAVKFKSASRKGTGEVEHCFSSGDIVEVAEGELSKLQGKIISIEGNTITIQPNHSDLKEPIAFQASELKKHFEPGQHVKVISGRYENDTGLVIRVEQNLAMILSDLTLNEIKVSTKDLQLCQERATGVDSTGHFQFGDLIMVDPQTVGVIVLLEKEFFEVLTIQGKVIRLKQNAVLRRRETRNAQAYDMDRNVIRAKDSVHVMDGPHVGQQGEIRHIYRSWAFIHNRMNTENGGLFVARTRHLSLRGGTSISSGKSSSSSSPMSGPGYAPHSPRLSASPQHPSQEPISGRPGGRSPSGRGGFGGGSGMQNQKRTDKSYIGKTVRIVKGVLKGSIGIVKDVMETEFQVELHFPYKTVLVKRENVGIVDSSGRIVGGDRFGASTGRVTPMYGDRTPMHGSQTPSYIGLRTPNYGSQTPMHDGSRTPHYGSQTPGHDGGATPRHAAFDPAGATPAYPGMGSSTPGNSHYDAHFDSSPSNSMMDLHSPNLGGLGSLSGSRYGGGGGVSAGSGISPMSSPGSVRTGTGAGGSIHDPYHASPSIYSPMGTSAPFTPATPSGHEIGGTTYGLHDDLGLGNRSMDNLTLIPSEYVTENTIVQVLLNDNPYKGVVKSIMGSTVELLLRDHPEQRKATVSIDKIYRLEPESGDKVRVMDNPNNMTLGHCLSVENEEGVVKLLETNKLKLYALKILLPYAVPDKSD